MNFSPQNRSTLETLLAALGSGMPASTAYPILQDTIAQQQQQQAERTAQFQQYAQQVAGLAQGGEIAGNAYTLMDLLTPKPGVPNKVMGQLETAYGAPAAPQLPTTATSPNQTTLQTSSWGQSQSPLYTQNPAVQAEQAVAQYEQQQAMMPSETQQKIQTIGEIVRIIRDARMQGLPDDQILTAIASDPYLMGVYVENKGNIDMLLNTATPFGTPA